MFILVISFLFMDWLFGGSLRLAFECVLLMKELYSFFFSYLLISWGLC